MLSQLAAGMQRALRMLGARPGTTLGLELGVRGAVDPAVCDPAWAPPVGAAPRLGGGEAASATSAAATAATAANLALTELKPVADDGVSNGRSIAVCLPREAGSRGDVPRDDRRDPARDLEPLRLGNSL